MLANHTKEEKELEGKKIESFKGTKEGIGSIFRPEKQIGEIRTWDWLQYVSVPRDWNILREPKEKSRKYGNMSSSVSIFRFIVDLDFGEF